VLIALAPHLTAEAMRQRQKMERASEEHFRFFDAERFGWT
jgi:hypothetical protein